MRHKIVTVAAAGVVGATSLAIAGPALAATVSNTSAAASSQVDRITEALKGLVTDKTLTQAQADKVASTLASADLGRGGPGGRGHGRGPGLAAAATALKMTEEDLHAALHAGTSLAQVAKEKGVSVDTLVAAMVEAEKDRIAQDVTDGRLTQAEADERLADVTARVTDRVNRVHPVRPQGTSERPERTATPAPSATTS